MEWQAGAAQSTLFLSLDICRIKLVHPYDQGWSMGCSALDKSFRAFRHCYRPRNLLYITPSMLRDNISCFCSLQVLLPPQRKQSSLAFVSYRTSSLIPHHPCWCRPLRGWHGLEESATTPCGSTPKRKHEVQSASNNS